MASMIAVISLFVVSLCTYSYSIPVGVQYNLSTPSYPFASNRSLSQNGSSWYSGSVGYQVSTGPSYVQHPRVLTGLSSAETTTAYGMTVTPRSIGESNSAESSTTYGTPFTPRSIGDSNSAESRSTYGTPFTPRSIGESNSAESSTTYGTPFTPRSVEESNSQEARAVQGSGPLPKSSTAMYSTLGSQSTFNQRAIPNSGEVEEITSTPSSGENQEGMSYVQSSTSVYTWPSKQKAGSSFKTRDMSGAQIPMSLAEDSAEFNLREPPPPPKTGASSMEQVDKRSYGSLSGGSSGPVIVDSVKSGPSSYGGDMNSYNTDSFPSKSAGKSVQRQKKAAQQPW